MRRDLLVTDEIAAAAVRVFLRERPRTVVLAGGTTPRAVYARLAEEEYDWPSLEVFFSDERCVPPEHPGSNYRMANETLLSKVPVRLHRMRGETCDASGYERELRSMFGNDLPAFDLTFLGLGEDGHTASLFPGDPALREEERWVVRVSGPTSPRLTLTIPVLSVSKLALFLVAGAEKRHALRRLIAAEDIPAARVNARRVVIIADKAAVPDTMDRQL